MKRFQAGRAAQKPKPASKKQKEPETFDEFMEEGVDSEEQGERYATGDRAQHKYERAAAMYEKAHQANEQDADCLYNWGRVLFVLVHFLPVHATPEEKLERVNESIEKFRQALRREENKTDAQFNLGQALHLRSEILQETTDIDDAYSQSAIALQEAITVFENVYAMQESEYNGYRTAEKESNGLLGQEPIATSDHHNSNSSSSCSTPEGKTAAEQGEEQAFSTVTQVETTTVYSLVETLVSMAETKTTMAAMLASYGASKDLFLKAQENLLQAKKWLLQDVSSAGSKEHREARIQIGLKEAQTLAAMADRTLLASDKVDHELFRSATAKLDEIVEQLDPRHTEAMCDRGDVLVSYAQACVEAADKKDEGLEPDTTGKEVWQLYAQATKSFQSALTIEPKNLRILTKLGEVSLARSELDLPVAKRNESQLLRNAEFYFKQAVKTDEKVLTGGWIGWAFSAWAQENRLNTTGKEQESARIIRSWIQRGGTEELLISLAEDNDALDEDFVTWASSQCTA